MRLTTPFVSCTGTLIAEDQVLTAHHCVAERDGPRYSRKNVAASRIRVELGGDYLPWGELGVNAIVAPPCGHAAGTGDIAVLVLERPVRNVPTLELRLTHAPALGDRVEPIGFGRCRDSDDGFRRRDRTGGKIERVLKSQFQLSSAICPGDSGGPGLDATGAVVGVISRSAMDGKESTSNHTEFTRVDRWPDVFVNARRISEGESVSELPPILGCDALD